MICLLFISRPGFAADDAYLRSLEAESNNSRTATSNSSGSVNNYLDALSEEAEASAKISAGSQHDDDYFRDMEKMESLLRSKKPSTYTFYKKLSPKNQARVFEYYAADKSGSSDRLTHLQKQILDAYFKK